MTNLNNYHPKISVITISFNAQNVVEETVKSVVSQSYDKIEYLVIDGCSKDKTLSIVENYKDKIAKVISERDNGIFDAMNKGIDLCTGDWCLFLNCGDYFYSVDSIKNAVALFDSDADIIYGDTEYRFDYGNEVLKPLKLEKVMSGAFCCHQSVFFKTSIIKKYKYDLSYKIIADWALFRKMYLDNCRFQYIDAIVASYDNAEGASTANDLRSFVRHKNEKARCMGEENSLKIKLIILIEAACFVIRRNATRFLPTPLYKKLKKIWIHIHR